MDNGFAILMLIFGILLLLYAALLTSGNHNLLPARVQPSLRDTDKKGQTRTIAKVLALVALPIALGGLSGLFWGNLVCLLVMGGSAAVIILTALCLHGVHRNRNQRNQ